jgi:hypothetical protein
MGDYANVLKSVDATSRTVGAASKNITAKNIASLWFGLVVMVFFTIATLWIVKKYVKKEAGNLWDFVAGPFMNLSARYKAAKKIEQTGVKPTADRDKAKDIGQRLYDCFHSDHDDEQRVYEILRNEIHNQADWDLVVAELGQVTCPKPLSSFVPHKGDLNHVLSHNLQENWLFKEKSTARDILKKKGINPGF